MPHDIKQALDSAKRALSTAGYALSLFETSPDPMVTVTLDGRISDANAAAVEVSGVPRKRLIGSNVASYFTDPEQAQVAVAHVLRGEAVSDLSLEIRHVDGHLAAVLCSVAAVRNEAGKIEGAIAVARDASSHRRAEEALQVSEERHRALFESSVAGVYRSTLDGRLLDCNQAMAEMLGYSSPQQLLEREALDVHDKSVDLKLFVPSLCGSGAVRGYETMLRRRDGRSLWVLEDATLVPDDTGELTVIEGTLIDITQRKQDEEERRWLLAAIERATEGIVITGTDGRIEYVNPTFEKTSGYSRVEVVGRDLRSLATEAHLDELYRGGLETALRGGTWQSRSSPRRRDGTTLETDVAIIPVRNARGAPIKLVVILRDVTDQVALQEQLLQAQKMEAIGQLAGGVAHDFNNLLQAMFSIIPLLRSRRHDQEQMAMLVSELEQQVRHGASLTRQLLLFSRRETTRRELLDLNGVVGAAVRMVRRLVRRSVTVEVEPAPNTLPIDADRGQLDQVLINLVVNASDAMPEGGRVVIRTGESGGAEVWLAVEDTGHGIPEAIRDHIFEPFFTTKERGKGTGLGLSVVHGIVAQHGGRIELDSAVGRGSTFTVFLPRVASDGHPALERPDVAEWELPPGEGERVLVVEDEGVARAALREVLAGLGYTALAVGSGKEALMLPPEAPFALLLTDLMLPGISGSDVARGLRERWPDLRVILMSGYAQDEILRRGIAERSVHFLQKPFDLSTLAREVRQALDDS